MNRNTPNEQTVNLDPQQVQQAAGAVTGFFNLDTTLIPGNLRGQVAVITTVLMGIAQGQLMVVSPVEKEVESPDGAGEQSPEVQEANAKAEKVAAIAEAEGIDDAGPDTGSDEPSS
jgi:hypothetical protein